MASTEVMRHNRRVLACLREGDLIEFRRGVYSHWAVYKGNEQVIHLAGDDSGKLNEQVNSNHLNSFSGQCFNKAIIRIDNFFAVAGTDKAKRNNNLDGEKRPLPRQQIVKKAMSRVGEVGYNVIIKNCQHFATWCRYGEASSDQVDFLVKTAALGVVAVAGIFIGAAVRRNNKSKKQS